MRIRTFLEFDGITEPIVYGIVPIAGGNPDNIFGDGELDENNNIRIFNSANSNKKLK